MGANKFATRLHRSTNKFTMILIYAVLEWILISLLLLNSLFSYLIIKFAEHVGLQPPCLWCSRIDHILEPHKKKNMHKDLLCQQHAREVALLGYCSNHQKLTESQELCEDCLSSKPEFGGLSESASFLGMVPSDGEEGLDGDCSCCGIVFEKKKMVPDIVIKPSWDVLEYAKEVKGELISEAVDDDDDDDDQVEKGVQFHDKNRSDEIEKMVSYVNEVLHTLKEEESVEEEEEEDEDEGKGKEEEIAEENQEYMVLKKDQGVEVVSAVEDDSCLELLPQHLEFFIDCSGHRLVPVELIDSTTEENQNEVEEEEVAKDNQENCLVIEEKKDDGGDAEHSVNNNGESDLTEFLLMEVEEQEDYSLVFHAKECSEKEDVSDPTSELKQSSTQESERNVVVQQLEVAEEEEKQHSDAHPGYVVDEDSGQIHMNRNESEADVSIGTEIPDLDNVTDEVMQTQEMEDEDEDEEEEKEDTHTQEYPSTGPVNPEADVHGSFQAKEQTMEYNSLSVEVNDNATRMLSLSMELSEVEDDRVPDTPTSVDSMHHLHKKLLLFGNEDSLDGSITSDFEGMVAEGGVITSEHLKSAIKAERKALHAIYSELEEERNASAIAANQTLAMINRLQEEKAAMQMEALQYQRMMEEQAEYDQEAMQLLNELMVKREREKEELEKELDVYRKKVLEYETKDKLRMLRRMNNESSGRNGFSSPSCSNAEESDAASIDLNQEVKEEEDSFYSHQQRDTDNENTPVGAVLNLEDSIADFEGERMSILEHLKVLEEKLMTIDDDEEEYLHDFEDISSPTVHHGESNGNGVFNENGQFEDLENGHSTNGLLTKENEHGLENGNGVKGFLPKENVNGKYHPLKSHIIGPMGKSLLPLFDATSDENGDIMLTNGNGFHGSDNGVDHSSHSLSTFEEGNKRRSAVEDELDHLYERLQALEADREFLKHCISSLNKGDKGTHLLHEILHHLKDLRHVDIHVRNLTDSSTK